MAVTAATLRASTDILPLDVLRQSVLPRQVQSGIDVSTDWEVLCSKARHGEAIRLLFVTSGPRDAPTSDIAGCARSAQGPAGHPATRPHRAEFRILGITAATAAQDTATNQGPRHRGIRIQRRRGDTMANDNAESENEAWARGVAEDELGSPHYRSVSQKAPSRRSEDGTRSGPPARKSLACGGLIEKCGLEGWPLFGPAGPPGTGPASGADQQPWPGGKGLATVVVAGSGARGSKLHTTTIPRGARVRRPSGDEARVQALEHAFARIDGTRGRCVDKSASRS